MPIGQPPQCFGKSWDPNDAECKGGHDPCYVNPRNSTHVRDKCSYYNECARTTSASQVAPQAQVVPVQNLIQQGTPISPAMMRPFIPSQGLPMPMVPPVPAPMQPMPPLGQAPMVPMAPMQPMQPQPRPPIMPPAHQHLLNVVQQQAPQWAPQLAQQLAAPAMAQYGPQLVPMNFQLPGAQMPGYLTLPEPIIADVPWYLRLFHELTRAALKSAFHQGANFFDHNPFRSYPAQAVQQVVQQ